MNYYEELIKEIEGLITKKEYEKAYYLVLKELEAPYIPKDIEKKIYELFDELKPRMHVNKEMDIEKIEAGLKGTNEEQLLSVNALIYRNLRDYLDIVNAYLTSGGFVNAKVILVDALIRQEINEEITYSNNGVDYTFIPKYVLPVDESDGYIEAVKMLESQYMKEPSKLVLAKDLLFKEAMLMLPVNLESEEAKDLVQKIVDYIESAFNM